MRLHHVSRIFFIRFFTLKIKIPKLESRRVCDAILCSCDSSVVSSVTICFFVTKMYQINTFVANENIESFCDLFKDEKAMTRTKMIWNTHIIFFSCVSFWIKNKHFAVFFHFVIRKLSLTKSSAFKLLNQSLYDDDVAVSWRLLIRVSITI